MKVDQADWNNSHFQQLWDLYSHKLKGVNNTEADKFIKDMKTSFIFENPREDSQRRESAGTPTNYL